MVWRSGTERAANGEAVLPIVVVGRIDVAGAVEVEVVGVGAVRVRGRRPVVAVVTGATEQVAILPDEAAPNPVNYRFYKKLQGLFVVVTTKKEHRSKTVPIYWAF